MVQEKAFQIKIEPKLNRQSSALLGSLGKAGSTGTGISALGATGIAGGIALLVSQLKVFQPVINIVKGIFQMLGQFLQPVADIIILLLRPILQILKPILIVVRQIMVPFRQLAFSLSRQAGEALREGRVADFTALTGLSLVAITTGVQAVFGFFSKEIIKSLIGSVGELLKGLIDAMAFVFGGIINFFGGDVEALAGIAKGFIDDGIKVAKDAIDFGVASFISAQTFLIAKAAATLGADVSKEFGAVNDMLRELFIGGENSFIGTFDSLTSGFESSLGSLIDVFRDKLNELNSLSGGGGGDFISRGIALGRGSTGGARIVGFDTRRSNSNIFPSTTA